MQYGHANLPSFTCGMEPCNRSYKLFDSFRKHVQLKHDIMNVASESKLYDKHSNNLIDNIDNSTGSNFDDDNRIPIETTPTIDKIVDPRFPTLTQQSEPVPYDSNNKNIVKNPQIPAIDNPVHFAAELHNYGEIPRMKVTQIIHSTKKLVDSLLSNITNQISHSAINLTDKKTILDCIKEIGRENDNAFQQVSSELMCFSTFDRMKTFIKPVSYLLGKQRRTIRNKGFQITRWMPVTAQFIPLRRVLETFFKVPGILDETLEYINSFKNNSQIIYNFMQGDLWRELSCDDGDKIYLPLFLAFDDYETDNPLGAHKGIAKCGAVYISIPCLPPRYASKLENIFLFLLFNSLNRKIFSNKIIFSKAKHELEYLEKEGITIDHPSGKVTIYFRLALLIADNLGMHEILGFVESFVQNKFCRFCLIDRANINTIFHEDACTLRTEENYDADVKRKTSKQTGIKSDCVLTGIGGFHPIKNLTADFVHDGLEGFCRYDLGLILHNFVKVRRLFSLQELNSRIKTFDYGTTKNAPPQITESTLIKKKLMMSAAEMWTLIRYLSLIISNLIPRDDEIWRLFQSMRDLVEMVMSYNHDRNAHSVLQTSISDYLRLLIQLFPGSLKPKHHFLVHYPRILLNCGPISKLSSFRFEAKHREGKIASRAAICRINVAKTIALKHQLRVNYRLMKNEFAQHLQFNKRAIKSVPLLGLTGVQNVINYLPDGMQDLQTIVSTIKRMIFEGIEIAKGTIIMMPAEGRPKFYEVQHIILDEKKENCTLIVKRFYDVFLNEHTGDYELLSHLFVWRVLESTRLYSTATSHVVSVTDVGEFIVKKWM